MTNNLHHNSIKFEGHLNECKIVEFLKPSDYVAI